MKATEHASQQSGSAAEKAAGAHQRVSSQSGSSPACFGYDLAATVKTSRPRNSTSVKQATEQISHHTASRSTNFADGIFQKANDVHDQRNPLLLMEGEEDLIHMKYPRVVGSALPEIPDQISEMICGSFEQKWDSQRLIQDRSIKAPSLVMKLSKYMLTEPPACITNDGSIQSPESHIQKCFREPIATGKIIAQLKANNDYRLMKKHEGCIDCVMDQTCPQFELVAQGLIFVVRESIRARHTTITVQGSAILPLEFTESPNFYDRYMPHSQHESGVPDQNYWESFKCMTLASFNSNRQTLSWGEYKDGID
jgi:hypothetical protein